MRLREIWTPSPRTREYEALAGPLPDEPILEGYFLPVTEVKNAVSGFERDGPVITQAMSRHIRIEEDVIRAMFQPLSRAAWMGNKFNIKTKCIDPWILQHYDTACASCAHMRTSRPNEARKSFVRLLVLARMGYNIRWIDADMSDRTATCEGALYIPGGEPTVAKLHEVRQGAVFGTTTRIQHQNRTNPAQGVEGNQIPSPLGTATRIQHQNRTPAAQNVEGNQIPSTTTTGPTTRARAATTQAQPIPHEDVTQPHEDVTQSPPLTHEEGLCQSCVRHLDAKRLKVVSVIEHDLLQRDNQMLRDNLELFRLEVRRLQGGHN